MQIIALKTLRDYWEQHPDARQPLQAWYEDARHAAWESPAAVKAVYRNASIVANNRVIFTIKGNDYRLIVAINYRFSIAYIRFVGSHAEYDKIDATAVQQEVQMEIKPIKTTEDYQTVLAEIEQLFDAEPDTPVGDQLEVLTTLLEAYEQRHYAIPAPDPVEAIRYHMESRGLSRHDLETALGSRARVSEILNHKRSLSLAMIRNLHNRFGIPAEALIQPCQLAVL